MTKNKIIILKLGGSVVTEKSSGQPRIKKTIARQLAKELKLFVRRHPQTKIILLHGAGSFGHPLVYKYKLLEKPFTKSKMLGFNEVVRSMRHMSNLLTDIFASQKLPVLPLQTSAITGILRIKEFLDAGFIPMLGGDMGITKKKQPVVISADRTAVFLAKAFPSSKIIFASDVDGVFDEFPPKANAKPIAFASRKNLEKLVSKMREQKSRRDVTGKMAGKLKNILELKKREVIIFNGFEPGGLTKALNNKQIGTRLEL